MSNFAAIQNVLSRINAIKTQIKSVTAPQEVAQVSFQSSLNTAMGEQGGMMPMGSTSGPESLNAILKTAGAAHMALGGISTGNVGQKLVEVAKAMDGKEFKPGERERCADFVSTMIEKTGMAPKDFKHEVNCWELQKQGAKVDKKDLKPGDIVYFGYTYLPVDYTHVGIYLGDGKFVHRPTAARPVVIDSINDGGYYDSKFCGARRLSG
jgi:hypothetical protein